LFRHILVSPAFHQWHHARTDEASHQHAAGHQLSMMENITISMISWMAVVSISMQ
jgi:hypothetical protein